MKGLEITRRRLHNSGLTETSFEAPDEVVRWHGAMQAQDYGPAKWSIGQRATKLVDADLDRALATGSILRTHVLRPTWHFVARDDIRWLLALTGPRVQQHNGPRYRELELDERTCARCEALIVSALEGGNHLTRNAIAGLLDDAGINRSGQRLPFILMHCELEAAISSGPLVGKQQTYALLEERAPNARRLERDEALAELARRYLTSHGPATVQDLRWWSSLTLADIRKALDMLGSEVQSETIDGITLWAMASDVSPPPIKRGVYLLQPYDELVVGYTESRYFGGPRAAAARAAWRDRSLPNGVVILNGRVAGHWRRTIERDSLKVEVVLYEDPKPGDVRALEAGAEDLGRFLGRRVRLEATRL
ncbi:MAG: winged helix DNA-binding domain-containing protein [Actinomycetota bacterium]